VSSKIAKTIRDIEAQSQQHSPVLRWLRSNLGDDFFHEVTFLDLYPMYPATDEDIARVSQLTELRILHLTGKTVTDDLLAPLLELPKLEQLTLIDCQVTDAMLEHLAKRRPKLKSLTLGGTQVTNAGLEHLAGCTDLEELSLIGGQFTTAGVWKLRRALPNCQIDYDEEIKEIAR
jgi:hypothetical protein